MAYYEPPDPLRFTQACRDILNHPGRPYAGCTEQELYIMRDIVATSYSLKEGRPLVSVNKTTSKLQMCLGLPRSPRKLIILQRLAAAIHSPDWTADLAIKAFNDIDELYFAGCLRNRVQVEWVAEAQQLAQLFGPTAYKRYAHTEPEYDGPVRVATITLNARLIFTGNVYTSRRKVMWGTLLHEMVHAFLYITCGATDVDNDQSGIDPCHGPRFANLCSMINRYTVRELGISVHYKDSRALYV